jgi:hypothetical protein
MASRELAGRARFSVPQGSKRCLQLIAPVEWARTKPASEQGSESPSLQVSRRTPAI